MININIDGIDVKADEGMTVLEAAKLININIPTLCYHEDLPAKSVCRVCAVEIDGKKTFTTSM